MNPRRSIVLAVVVAGLAIGAFRALHQGGPARPLRPNVLLVTFDTTRVDHLSAFGYPHPTTPTLAALADQGFRFERAYSPMPATGPAHASLMTGAGPRETGVVRNGRALRGEAVTLAERLRAAGYRTGAVVSGYPLAVQFGLNQGFERYDDAFPEGTASIRAGQWNGRRLGEAYDRRADATADRAIALLDSLAAPGAPFFMFVHFFDPHSPYEPPQAFAGPPEASAAERYDGEIRFADAQFARILDALRRRGALASTLVVFASDHGEGLGQHGVAEHGPVVYDEALRVPLLVAWPGVLSSGRSQALVGLSDVTPTVLELVGLAAPAGGPGRGVSLTPVLFGGKAPEPRRLVLEAAHDTLRPQRAVTDGRLKLVERGPWRSPRQQLFDLLADPGEQVNVLERHPQVARALAADLPPAPQRAEIPAMDPADAEALRALGYLR